MSKPRILVFAGSTRRESFNRRLAVVAAASVEAAGGEATLLELADHPMPLYDGDLEAEHGLPEGARSFKRELAAHPGWLIACPEYNSSITPLLKNSIDWASRSEEGKGSLECFTGKVIGLVSASPGALGGMRGLVTVRSIFSNIGSLVLPQQVSVMKAGEAFTGDELEQSWKQRIDKLAARLVEVTSALAG
jgi:NAD(P)H-dependent FMN reductase